MAFFRHLMENFPENNKPKSLNLSFKKRERLCSKKIIDHLFAEGKSIIVFPLKIVFVKTQLSHPVPVQAAFTVSKKAFKKAVQRNLIKRKLRESYRLNKTTLYNSVLNHQLAIFIIYIGKDIPDYPTIDLAMKKGIKKVIKDVEQN